MMHRMAINLLVCSVVIVWYIFGVKQRCSEDLLGDIHVLSGHIWLVNIVPSFHPLTKYIAYGVMYNE
jgi:hypothetical protein